MNISFKTFRPQILPFPDTIVYYITTSPSSAKGYLKLIQSCKYFFAKNPILVIEDLRTNAKNSQKWIAWLGEDCKYIDFTNISNKLWIANNFLSCADSSLNSWIIPRIYRCDAKILHLYNQNISYNEFLFFSANVRNITLRDSIIMKEDQTIFTLQELVKDHPKFKDITILGTSVASYISSKTVEELLKIPHFSSIQVLNLDYIPETFDIEMFFTYVKARMSAKITLNFRYSPLSAAYRDCLARIVDEIINEIMNRRKHSYKVVIDFVGLAHEKYRVMTDHLV